jgi:hypothetical protein
MSHSNWRARAQSLPIGNSCKEIASPKPEKEQARPKRHSEPSIDAGKITATQQWNYCGSKNAPKQKPRQRNDPRTERNETAKTESVDDR